MPHQSVNVASWPFRSIAHVSGFHHQYSRWDNRILWRTTNQQTLKNICRNVMKLL